MIVFRVIISQTVIVYQGYHHYQIFQKYFSMELTKPVFISQIKIINNVVVC